MIKVSFSVGMGNERRLLDKQIVNEFPRLGAGDSRKQEEPREQMRACSVVQTLHYQLHVV